MEEQEHSFANLPCEIVAKPLLRSSISRGELKKELRTEFCKQIEKQ
jgi:hypothetical protein